MVNELWDRALHSGVTTLNYDYQVQSSKKAFEEMPKIKLEAEMLDLARHIISTKKGTFDPATFDDRYEAALTELVEAKVSGKALPRLRPSRFQNRMTCWKRFVKVLSCRKVVKPNRNALRPTPTGQRPENPPPEGQLKARHRPRHAERLVDHA